MARPRPRAWSDARLNWDMPSASHEAYLIVFAYGVAPCVGLSDVNLYGFMASDAVRLAAGQILCGLPVVCLARPASKVPQHLVERVKYVSASRLVISGFTSLWT